VKQDLLDDIAIMEVEALLEGLNDPERRKNPAFLEKVRKFLKENNFMTTPETPGIVEIQRETEEIPDFNLQ